jgi:hypothetical protein
MTRIGEKTGISFFDAAAVVLGLGVVVKPRAMELISDKRKNASRWSRRRAVAWRDMIAQSLFQSASVDWSKMAS